MPASPAHRTGRRLAATACTLSLAALLTAPAASAAPVGSIDPIRDAAENAVVQLNPTGTFETGVYDEGAAEIVQVFGDRIYQVNAAKGAIDVLDMSDPSAPTLLYTISAEAGVANSVAIREDGLGVVALEDASDKTANGRLLFFDATADSQSVLGEVTVGALPDMVTFSDDGAYAVVANEGEPNDDFTVDPEGSVGVVSLPADLAAPAQDDVQIANFHAFEGDALPGGVRVFGPAPHGDDLPVSRNLEPEYVTVSGTTAYVALQENNSIAVVDLPTATVTDLLPLGAKNWGEVPLDPSDRDPEDAPTINLKTYPGLQGLYMPDGLHSYEVDGETYLVTANEGDMREWGDFVGGERVKNLAEDGQGPVCAELEEYTADDQLGRLEVVFDLGFDEEAGCYSELYAYGARSFSIFTTDGELVFDSGAQFEEITAALSETTDLVFNSGHDNNEAENRSDAKGVEPENLAIGELEGKTYAFIGFERLSGVIVYDITDPAAPVYESYINNREFETNLGDEYEALEEAGAGEAELATLVNQVGDLGPEGLDFVPADASPSGEPLLVVGNEVTGTTTIYTIAVANDEATPTTPAPEETTEPSEPGATPVPETTEPAPSTTADPSPIAEETAPPSASASEESQDPAAAATDSPTTTAAAGALAETGASTTVIGAVVGVLLAACGITLTFLARRKRVH